MLSLMSVAVGPGCQLGFFFHLVFSSPGGWLGLLYMVVSEQQEDDEQGVARKASGEVVCCPLCLLVVKVRQEVHQIQEVEKEVHLFVGGAARNLWLLYAGVSLTKKIKEQTVKSCILC